MNIRSVEVCQYSIRVNCFFGCLEVYYDFSRSWEYLGGSTGPDINPEKIARKARRFLRKAAK